MKESAQAAQSYLWANAQKYGIDKDLFSNSGLHIHVPKGATPKDGPSAGVTIAASLASLYMNTAVRSDTAMTGELTLTGLILPIGGLKEKVLAAHRAGLKRIVIPKSNEKDLRDIPTQLHDQLSFFPVEKLDEALDEVLIKR